MREPHVSFETETGSAGFEALFCTSEHLDRAKNYLEEQRRLDAFSSHHSHTEAVAILKNMWVEEEERGNGIGKELMDEFFQISSERGIHHIYLVADTYEDNEFDLVSWYESYGFAKVNALESHCPLLYLKQEV